ncbi:hypothetical protein D3C80_1669910 [compost metagenome]
MIVIEHAPHILLLIVGYVRPQSTTNDANTFIIFTFPNNGVLVHKVQIRYIGANFFQGMFGAPILCSIKLVITSHVINIGENRGHLNKKLSQVSLGRLTDITGKKQGIGFGDDGGCIHTLELQVNITGNLKFHRSNF